MLRWIQFAQLLGYALLVGFMAMVQWSLVPAQNQLDATAYTVLEQGMNRTLEWLTATLLILTTAASLLVAARLHRDGGRARLLGWVAFAVIAAMVTSTLLINAGANFAIDTWDPAAPPADWTALRDRWELGHAIRSYLGLAGLAAALAAAVWPASESDG